jgi:hypothetical protein
MGLLRNINILSSKLPAALDKAASSTQRVDAAPLCKTRLGPSLCLSAARPYAPEAGARVGVVIREYHMTAVIMLAPSERMREQERLRATFEVTRWFDGETLIGTILETGLEIPGTFGAHCAAG